MDEGVGEQAAVVQLVRAGIGRNIQRVDLHAGSAGPDDHAADASARGTYSVFVVDHIRGDAREHGFVVGADAAYCQRLPADPAHIGEFQ